MATSEPLRVALIGAGWIAPIHLAALDRLGRTNLVGVAARRAASAEAIAGSRGVPAYDDWRRLLDEGRPDVAWVCVPPDRAVEVGLALVDRGIPFLVEKPLAAADGDEPPKLATAIAGRGLTVAVGYHLRGLHWLPEVRERLTNAPARLVLGRWLDATPAPAWWRRAAQGGGQVIEQATHLYDLARHLVGEAEVVAATAVHETPAQPPDADVADSTTAILRFASGAIGTVTNTRRAPMPTVDLTLVSEDAVLTFRRAGTAPGGWELDVADSAGQRTVPAGRDPYEIQAEAFLDAVETDDPGRVLSSYADALKTDQLTRAVVAATGLGG